MGRSSFLEADVTMTFDKKAVKAFVAFLIVVVLVVGTVLLSTNWSNITAGIGGERITTAQLEEAWQAGWLEGRNSAAIPALLARITELEQELADLWEYHEETVTRMQAEIDRLRAEVERAQGFNEMYRNSLVGFFEQFREFLPHLDLDEFLLEFYHAVETDLVGELAFLNADLALVPNLNTLQQTALTAHAAYVAAQTAFSDFRVIEDLVKLLAVMFFDDPNGVRDLFRVFWLTNAPLGGTGILTPNQFMPGTIEYVIISRIVNDIQNPVVRYYMTSFGEWRLVTRDRTPRRTETFTPGVPWGTSVTEVDNDTVLFDILSAARNIVDLDSQTWGWDWLSHNITELTRAANTARTNFNNAQSNYDFWVGRRATIESNIARAQSNLAYVRNRIAELGG